MASTTLTVAPEPADAFRAVKTMEMDAFRDWVQQWRDSRNPGGLEEVESGNSADDVLGASAVLREVLARMRDDSPKQSTLLHWASYLGFVEAVYYLLDLGASPFVQESDGKTPLHWACFEGHAPVVSALLKAAEGNTGPDGLPLEQMRDKLNHTACHLAMINRHDSVAEMCPNYSQVKGAASLSPYRSKSRQHSAAMPGIATNTDEVPAATAGAGTSTSVEASSSEAPEGKPPLTPNHDAVNATSGTQYSYGADSPHELYSVVPQVAGGASQSQDGAGSEQSPSQSRWSRRNRNRNHLLSPRSTQPPPRIGELKEEAENEERRPFLEEGGVPPQRRSETPPANRAISEENPEQVYLQEEQQQEQYSAGQQSKEVSPGGVETYHQQASAQSYDELPDENDPNLTEEERTLIRQLQDVQRKKERAERRQAREDRRQERTGRITEIRGYIQNWVSRSLDPDAPPPQELLSSLENAGIIPTRTQDGTIHWTDGGKRKSRSRTNRSSKSRDMSTSQGSYNNSSDPMPDSRYPHPHPFNRNNTDGSVPNTARTEGSTYSGGGVRIPATRFPPSTDLYEPVSRSTRSHSSGKSWKPPSAAQPNPLEAPLLNPRVERLRAQDRNLRNSGASSGQMTPTRQPSMGGGFEAASPTGSLGGAPRPRDNIPQPAAQPPSPMVR